MRRVAMLATLVCYAVVWLFACSQLWVMLSFYRFGSSFGMSLSTFLAANALEGAILGLVVVSPLLVIAGMKLRKSKTV